MDEIRVRYAPSPTGYIHIGNLRTALYNYLFAKNQKGKLILRIEDTDRTRYIPGATENLINTLEWAGIEYDEGPLKEGEYKPYFQSERLDIYRKYCDELLKSKKAYYCFCSPERLNELREEQLKLKLNQTKYDKHCLHLSQEDIDEKLKNNQSYVIRLNVKHNQKIQFTDYIRGNVEFSTDLIDDQILIKSDGYPTYHLANVIDDHLMKISHVIRGEEWLPSTPKHIILYNAFNWETPVFAHLPLLLNPDRSKLSKRQGDVAVEDYKLKGYLPEALINFIALLGWTAGDDREYYEMNELIESFSLDRVNKSGAVFDLEKLSWLNEEHLRAKPVDVLLSMLRDEINKSKYKDKTFEDSYLINVVEAMKPRISFIKEIIEKAPYFFEEPETYDEVAIKKRWKENSADMLKSFSEKIRLIENPDKEDYERELMKTSEEFNTGVGNLIHPIRLAVSGVSGGPGVYDILEIIGKEATLNRIKNIITRLT